MRFGWARGALAAVAAVSLAGCGQVFGEPNAAETSPLEAPAGAADPAAMKAFLDKNARAEGVVVLPSGVQYKVERSGPSGGQSPAMGDEVKVHYEGALIDGTVFDSSYERGAPATFTVGQLVPGFDEILQRMKPGDVWHVYIPPEQGYGDRGGGPIPPGSVLTFKVELLGVLPAQGSTANG